MTAKIQKTDKELAADHKYKLLSGEVAVNVTAISGLMDDGKSGAFAGAAVKLTLAGKNHREEWKASGERGTRVHGHCEAFLRGKGIDQADEDKGYVDALEKFIIDVDPEVIELEEIVLSSLGYGGRFDMIIRPRQGKYAGKVLLVDLKTGKQYAVEHTLQTAAYRYADGIAVYGGKGELASLRKLPIIEHAACLYVAEDGTYRLVEYPADEQAFGAFRALLKAYLWTRTPEIKAVVKASKAKP